MWKHPTAGPEDQDAMFLNRFGTRLTTRSIGRMLEKYLMLTGLDKLHDASYSSSILSPPIFSTAGNADLRGPCRNCWGTRV